jgi:hypothetical protein
MVARLELIRELQMPAGYVEVEPAHVFVLRAVLDRPRSHLSTDNVPGPVMPDPGSADCVRHSGITGSALPISPGCSPRLLVSPSPSCPDAAQPQHLRLSSSSRAHRWL